MRQHRYVKKCLLWAVVSAVLPAAGVTGAMPVDRSGGVADAPAAVLADPGTAPPAAAPLVIPGPRNPLQRYIVVLADPPLAQYRGGIAGLRPTALDAWEGTAEAAADGTAGAYLDATTAAAGAYRDFLRRQQDRVIDRLRLLAPELRVDWRYTLALNGFTVALTPQHAMAAMELDDVIVVYPEETLEPEMDGTAGVVGTAAAWDAAGGVSEAGLGVRIGILDSGADALHPFFADDGMPAAPTGFPAATLHGRGGTVLEYPDADQLTNNKVIATRVFSTQATEQVLASQTPWAHLSGSHGLHVAGIASGRYGTYSTTVAGKTVELTMGGVAPMAHVLVYVNFDSTPGMLAAYEQMLLDHVNVVNISQGQVGWLLSGQTTHPVTLAQTAAAEAGLLTVASSGNAGGNGRTSLSGAWKYSDNILVVGNTTSTGSFEVEAATSGAGVPAEVQALAMAPYSAALPAAAVEGDLYLAPGGGCAPDANANGKVVVVEYANEGGAVIGGCSVAVRANTLQQSGAVAMLVVWYNYYVGPLGAANLAVPTYNVGRHGGLELTDWLKGGATGRMTIQPNVRRAYGDLPDMLVASSSRGPGLSWSVKPDISAPGNNIMSSLAGAIRNAQGQITGVNRYFGASGGTSMSSPHVTGAAALVKSVHPGWSVAKLRSALVTTAQPVVQTGSFASPYPASVTDGGPGRLDVEHALNPGAFLYPHKLSFGAVPEDISEDIEVTIESASDDEETWTLEVEPVGGDAFVEVDPPEITLAPGASDTFYVTLDTLDVDGVEHYGHVVLRREGTDQVLRQAYYAYVDQADARRDVLLVNWTYGNTADYTDRYTQVMDDLGISYTVWNMGDAADNLTDRRTTHPTFEEMVRHDLVILNANMSPVVLTDYLTGQYQYQNYLLAGGNMLIAGQGTQGFWRSLSLQRYADTAANRAALPDTFPRAWVGPIQNGGCEMCLARYFAGYTPVLTATLSDRLLVPYPTAPDEPERQVVLARHAEADGPFHYSLDISTGDLAPPGAAGNQYRFNSGRVISDYEPTTGSGQVTAQLGDIDYAETVLGQTIPLARPLWTYTAVDAEGNEDPLTVGTYVAGRQHTAADPRVAWNAMYWGFGLEGVGEGAPGTVSQARLLGDTINFLAHNLYASLYNVGISPDSPSAVVRAVVSPSADEVMIVRSTVDWGDGEVDEETFAPRVLPSSETFTHTYAASGSYVVTVTYYPAAGQGMAPIHASLTLDIVRRPAGIFLPILLANHPFTEATAEPTPEPTIEITPVPMP